MQLRAHKVRDVCFDGESRDVASVGLLKTEVTQGGEPQPVPNRLVLEARLRDEPARAGAR